MKSKLRNGLSNFIYGSALNDGNNIEALTLRNSRCHVSLSASGCMILVKLFL